MQASTQAKIHIFHKDAAQAALWIEKLRDAGYAVSANDHRRPPSLRKIKNLAPAAIVIDLSRAPSYGRSIGAWLRGSKSTRLIPLVFAGGDPAKVAALRKEMSDAVYSTLTGVRSAVKRAIANPPAEPIVPPQMMQGYEDRSTAQKLGIREASVVGLIDPPAAYLRVLGELPRNVVIEEVATPACTVALWFVHDPGEYAAALPRHKDLAASSRLWIIWKKGGRKGINGNVVRDAARQVNLTDYKICSLNTVWSGMAFALKPAGR